MGVCGLGAVRRSAGSRRQGWERDGGSVYRGCVAVMEKARIQRCGTLLTLNQRSDGHTLEEAKSINLSLSSLGKCISALAESSAHVRDSKLTRLLKDSFGVIVLTVLHLAIGFHTHCKNITGCDNWSISKTQGETTSTIVFGQRAMKVQNMVKLKEEFDNKSLCRRLDIELDKLIAENERQRKYFDDEVERITAEARCRIAEAERDCKISLEVKETESTSNGDVHDLLQNEKMLRQADEDESNDLRNQLSHWKKMELPLKL